MKLGAAGCMDALQKANPERFERMCSMYAVWVPRMVAELERRNKEYDAANPRPEQPESQD